VPPAFYPSAAQWAIRTSSWLEMENQQELWSLSCNIDSPAIGENVGFSYLALGGAGPDRCRSPEPKIGCDKQGLLTYRGCLLTILVAARPHPMLERRGEVCLQHFSHDLHFPQGVMDDQVLSSLCRDPISYCTFDEQKAAIDNHKSPQRMVSPDGNTYIHMVIAVSGHWVAIQVTISPFTLEQFRGQTFFSSQLRYGPCCRQINNTDTSHLVVGIVQRVVDSYYRPVCWDYSSNQWYVDLSS
jgi:hypothetical protein